MILVESTPTSGQAIPLMGERTLTFLFAKIETAVQQCALQNDVRAAQEVLRWALFPVPSHRQLLQSQFFFNVVSFFFFESW